jgi:hypothetical protein
MAADAPNIDPIEVTGGGCSGTLRTTLLITNLLIVASV